VTAAFAPWVFVSLHALRFNLFSPLGHIVAGHFLVPAAMAVVIVTSIVAVVRA